MKQLLFFLLTILMMACSKDNDTNSSPQAIDTLATGWKKIQLATSEQVNDIFFINNSTGYAIAGRSIFRSVDGGNNWQKVHEAAHTMVNMAMGNVNNAIFTSMSNTILLTKDGGISFDSVAITDNPVRDVFFVNATVAYVVGDKTWKTTNAGNNWSNLSSFTSKTFPSPSYKFLHFLNEQTGWVTGEGFFKTTNGGVTWDSIPRAGLTFGDMGTISFPDANTGYITEPTTIYKTSNGGVTFTKIFATHYRAFHDIHFINSQTGYATDQEYILKTTDGGQIWTKDVRIISKNIIELHFTDASHGWASGSSGFILKYEQ